MRGLRIKSLDQLGPRAAVNFPSAPAVAGRVRVLGIDPGSRRTGFGVIDCTGPRVVYIASGAIVVGGRVFTDRLRTIFEKLRDVIAQFRPDEIAIERVFVHKNADSALKLGQARGAALCAVLNGQTHVYEYAPRAVKHAITGYGAAEKTQVSFMVRRTLAVEGKLTADAADALALALCHAQSRTLLKRLGR